MDNIQVFDTTDKIAAAALDYVLKAADESIAEKGVFNLALTGGSTPRKLYELLAQQKDIEWQKWRFFMGDERYVPPDDERSNQHLAQETLLSKVPIDVSQVYAVPVDEPDVEAAARAYESAISKYFGTSGSTIPSFDLILLGMGSDTHTASLFPGKDSLEVTDRLVVSSSPGVLPPPVDRVTFTLPLINATHRVLFMAAGADKAEAFQKVHQDLHEPPEKALTPAGMVRPDGELHWFVDRAMAGTEL